MSRRKINMGLGSKMKGFTYQFVRGGMDMTFIKRNWSAINRTPIRHAGLLVRKIMRGSIRRAYYSKKTNQLSTKPSPPGTPPRARAGADVKGARGAALPFKYILSIPFDHNTKAVIGHAILPIKKQDPAKTPMQLHEFGERTTIRMRDPNQRLGGRRRAYTRKQAAAARRKFLAGTIKGRAHQPIRWISKDVTMPKRPFARPALMTARKRLGIFWRNCVNKGTVRK